MVLFLVLFVGGKIEVMLMGIHMTGTALTGLAFVWHAPAGRIVGCLIDGVMP